MLYRKKASSQSLRSGSFAPDSVSRVAVTRRTKRLERRARRFVYKQTDTCSEERNKSMSGPVTLKCSYFGCGASFIITRPWPTTAPFNWNWQGSNSLKLDLDLKRITYFLKYFYFKSNINQVPIDTVHRQSP